MGASRLDNKNANSVPTISESSAYSENELSDFDFPIISEEEKNNTKKEIEKKIEEFTGFRAYHPEKIEINKIQKEIKELIINIIKDVSYML